MASQEEEMTDDFEEEETDVPSPSYSPFANVTANKPEKPLFEQYRETREKEEAEHAGEREQLEARLRACLAQNPKIEIGKPSAVQEKVEAMDLPTLRRAVIAAEDQVGLGTSTIIPKSSLKVLNRALTYGGMQLAPEAYEDPLLLHVINRNLPIVTWKYGEWIQTFCRLLEHIRFPGQSVHTPTETVDPEIPVDQ